MATITGGSGDDPLNGTGDPDDITGGTGNDTINGGAGGDLIEGGLASIINTALFLDWTAQGGNGTNLAGGFTQNTGGVNVTVGFTAGPAGTTATVETGTQYTETGEPFDTNSGLDLRGSGSGDTWTIDLGFAGVPGSGFSDDVENVTFRIQDIDAGGWQDEITIIALDASGNPVPVTITPSGDDTVSGNTVTAGPTSTGTTDPLGSALVSIAGPVSSVQIVYANAGTGGQLLYLTDVHFEAVPSDDDVINGGAGDDTIFGNVGDDLIDGGADNDLLEGGAGADTLIGGTGADTLDGGTGADLLQGGDDADEITAGSFDTIDGGEGGTDTDTLIVNDVERVEFDPLNGENGTVFFNDGTSADFTNIETLIVNGGPDGIIQGSAEADLIDSAYVDPNLELIDNGDGIIVTSGDIDSIEAGTGNDTIYAGQANDTVIGGPDAEVITAESLNWSREGVNGTDLSGGFTQDTGAANISVTVTNDGGLTSAVTSGTAQYVDTGEPFAPNSGISLTGNGGGNVATLGFTSDAELTNVSFRLSDIDGGGWQDILTVNAFDADGNPVPVTLTASGDETIAGNQITGGPVNDDASFANGSVLVEIAGPITSFEVIYANGGTGGQVVWMTDVHFSAIAPDNDLIHGDQGSDSLLGGVGDDTIFGDQLALDPTSVPSGTTGTATSVTFDNQSPFAVELAQIDATGTILPGTLIPAGTDLTTPSTTQTNWVLLDPDTGDILELYEAPPDGSTQVFDSQAADTLEGGLGDDSLSGDFGNDSLLGDAGDDTLAGGTGADTLDGGDDNDLLDGGQGDDLIIVGPGDDTASGGDDQDVFALQDGFGSGVLDGNEGGTDFDTLDASNLTNPVNVVFTGDEAGEYNDASSPATIGTFSNIEAVTGTSGDDTIDATLSGLAQTLSGGDGADSVLGGAGDDSVEGGIGNDTLGGGGGADTIIAGTGDDSVDGGAGDDTIEGGLGTDTLLGGAGNDTLDGGDGPDDLQGGNDADLILGGSGDVVDGGEGGVDDDTLYLGTFDFTVVYDPLNPENGVITFSDLSTLTFSNIENLVACFTPGTRIATDRGEVRIEDLSVGDLVLTRDNGYQPIRWIGQKELSQRALALQPDLQPICIQKGALARGVPERDMIVSPQHRMLIDCVQAQFYLGDSEVLIKAKDMLRLEGVKKLRSKSVTYIHLMLPAHEIILADGAWTESYQPNLTEDREQERELMALFPELAGVETAAGFRSARNSAKWFEAQVVLEARAA